MRYFAELDNQSKVKRVIRADSLEWCVQNLGGQWVETFMDRQDKNGAAIGHTFDSAKQDFIAPKPYASFKLNNRNQWMPPKAPPKQDGVVWNEKKQDWDVIN